MGMGFLALGFLQCQRELVKPVELPIEQNEQKLDRTKEGTIHAPTPFSHNRTNAFVTSNLDFWFFKMGLLVTLTVACAPRTQPADEISPQRARTHHATLRITQPYGYQIVRKSSASSDKLEKLFKFAHPGFRVFQRRKSDEMQPDGGLTRIRS